ncbi:MAG: hypothetical protein H6765_01665 [Candidatus Peribacteria bacterium]|nr:MAG: hypothetical protein H6765_01665 [Candidatus Peribacteria bacterium]
MVYFLRPANIFLYGINDIHDYETDKANPKKLSYEQVVTQKQHASLYAGMLIRNIPFLTYFVFRLPLLALVPLAVFLLLLWQ